MEYDLGTDSTMTTIVINGMACDLVVGYMTTRDGSEHPHVITIGSPIPVAAKHLRKIKWANVLKENAQERADRAAEHAHR